jgi:hypothetical protein
MISVAAVSTSGTAYTGRANGIFSTNDQAKLKQAGAWPTAITAPAAPTIGTVVAGNLQAAVSFTAPSSLNGETIISYTVTSSPGGYYAYGVSSPITVSSLIGGTSYTFTVVANSASGSSTASSSVSAFVVGVPTAPTIGTASYTSGGNATVSFSAPSSDGGATITGYKIYANGTLRATVSTSPASLTGLSDGTLYQFQVVAVNTAGDSPFSGNSNQVGITVPSPPSHVTLTNSTYYHPNYGNMISIKVSAGTSSNNGGSAIIGYRFRIPALGINVLFNDAYQNLDIVTNNINYLGGYATSTLVGNTYYQATLTAVNAVGESSQIYSNNLLTLMSIGSSYGGGYYIGTFSNAGTTYKAIVAPKLGGVSSAIKALNFRPYSGGHSATDGLSNTNELIEQNSSGAPAATFCKTTHTSGYSDWYLPSSTELDLYGKAEYALPSDQRRAWENYWSSSRFDYNFIYYLSYNQSAFISSNRDPTDATYYGGSPYSHARQFRREVN